MKHIIEFCVSEISKCEAELKPYFDKYEVDNSLKLSHCRSLLAEDIIKCTSIVQHKDSYVQLVNRVLEKYQPGMLPSDEDLDRKRRALFSVVETVLTKVSKDGVVKWDTMDSIPTSNHLEQVAQCIMANELELALFGISYILYQKHHEKTNLADRRIQDAFQNPL
jgi:hypothetical protein